MAYNRSPPWLSALLAWGKYYHLPDDWLETHPHLFAISEVPVSATDQAAMQRIITAVETVVCHQAFQQYILQQSDTHGQHVPLAQGVFFGYDFHLTPQGPKLIEINTNASGAALLAMRELAQFSKPDLSLRPGWERTFFEMFATAWRRQRGHQPLRHVAIVDNSPQEQFFYPEFLLFQAMFAAQGVSAVIADPSELVWRDQRLFHHDTAIDLVYNRLTDFLLTAREHAALWQAYVNEAVVLTPHPHAYALYADKRNLIVLSDSELLHHLGIDAETINVLQSGVPHTVLVDPTQADSLWANRENLFFKPVSGFAGKGVYRGYRITHKVFNDILKHPYIAQTTIPPSELMVDLDGVSKKMKVDVRNYVDNGLVFRVIARLYQGQTTNMRTEGGGFAVVSPNSSPPLEGK